MTYDAPVFDMVQEEKHETLSDLIARLFRPERGVVELGQLLEELDHHGLAVVLIFFAIPAALPLPAAGYSTLLSFPLFCIALGFMLGRQSLWLPQSLRRRSINLARFGGMYVKMIKLVKWIESFTKPRMVSLARAKATRRALGGLVFLLACSMVLPIPGTNTLPAGGVFLIGFSLLEDDGLLLLLGVLYSLMALVTSVFIIVFGYAVVKGLLMELSGLV